MRCFAHAAGILMLSVIQATSALGQVPAKPPSGDTSPVDYTRAEAWLCRPDITTTCFSGLDAEQVAADGAHSPAPFVPARNPPIDCFYLYPTASDDPTFYAGLKPDAWVIDSVRSQAARLGEVCRVFAPAYHQLSIAGLMWFIAQGAEQSPARLKQALDAMGGIPERDVRAAWRYYLKHDNHGRGVVLIGHSQGAIILRTFLPKEVIGKPVQKQLVAAYLAGNPDLGTGDLHGLPLCDRPDRSGCVVAWSSYTPGYAGPRFFGHASNGTPVCVNPARPGSASAPLDSFIEKPAYRPTSGDKPSRTPGSEPAFMAWKGRIEASCVVDARGATLRVGPTPGAGALEVSEMLRSISEPHPNYGLHMADIELMQGSIISLIRRQTTAFQSLSRHK
jgi:hypothetical protein